MVDEVPMIEPTMSRAEKFQVFKKRLTIQMREGHPWYDTPHHHFTMMFGVTFQYKWAIGSLHSGVIP